MCQTDNDERNDEMKHRVARPPNWKPETEAVKQAREARSQALMARSFARLSDDEDRPTPAVFTALEDALLEAERRLDEALKMGATKGTTT
jgi:hypothetical protein